MSKEHSNNNGEAPREHKITFAEDVKPGDDEEKEEEEEENGHEFEDLRSHLKSAKSFLVRYDALTVAGNFPSSRRGQEDDGPSTPTKAPESPPKFERQASHSPAGSHSKLPDEMAEMEDQPKSNISKSSSAPPSHVSLTRMVMKGETPPGSYGWSMMSTLNRRRAQTRTMKRIQAELLESSRDNDIMRLQQQLKISNATARELDEVILFKNQEFINQKATQAEKVLGKEVEVKGTVRGLAEAPITMDDRLERAAIYIKDAIEGRETVSRSALGVSLWQITSSQWYKIALILVILYHMAVAFGEPASRDKYDSVSYNTTRGLYISEFFCVVIYAVDIVLRGIVNGWRYFLKSPSRSIFIVVVVIIFFDVIVALGLEGSVRPTRCLRPLLLLTKSRTLREITSTIIRTLRRLVDLVLLILILMVTYSVVGVQLYYGKYPAATNPQNFDDVSNALLTLYVLLTTESYPTIMIPAYEASPWSVLYFLSFMFIVAYLLMSVLVAVVLDTYKSLRKEKLIKDRITERRGLATAFRLLDVDGSGHIEYSLWEKLFTIVSPQYDPTQVRLLFQTIDEDRNGKVNIIEFFELCDVLLLRFRKDDEEVSMVPQSLIDFCNKYIPRKAATAIAQTRIFHMLVIFIILGNIIVLCLLGRDHVDNLVLYKMNLAFLCLFVIEMVIKIVAWGSHFWIHLWNKFDFGIMLVVVIAQIASLSAKGVDSFSLNEEGYIRILNAISSLRILRIISSFRRTRLIAFTVTKLAPLMLSVVSLLVCVFYFYAIIGMEAFATNVNVNLVTRFSTFPYAMLALFQQLTQSDWHSVMYQAMHETTFSVSWYFVTFNILVVIIILNLLIALVIDTFVLQHEILTSQQDILLEIPDPENKVTRKSKWRVWKDLGSKWERELITRHDIPELQEEDFKKASENATNELEQLKNRRTPEQKRRSRPSTPSSLQSSSASTTSVEATFT